MFQHLSFFNLLDQTLHVAYGGSAVCQTSFVSDVVLVTLRVENTRHSHCTSHGVADFYVHERVFDKVLLLLWFRVVVALAASHRELLFLAHQFDNKIVDLLE